MSLHAVGARGTAPLGWALYLPEEWCSDGARRRKAKILEEVAFRTKPEPAAALAAEAADWEIPSAPILADAAYGDDTRFRTRLQGLTLDYVVAVSSQIGVFGPGTTFSIPERTGRRGRSTSALRADRKPQSSLISNVAWACHCCHHIDCRNRPDLGEARRCAC